MKHTLALLACLTVSGLLTACGGGGGGNDGDNQPQEVLLFEFSIGLSGLDQTEDDTYECSVVFAPNDTKLLLATVDTNADGDSFDADPLDPEFAQLVLLLTNGQSDNIFVEPAIAGGNTRFGNTDTQPLLRRSPDLIGPDLVGATITRMGLRVDAVDIVTDNGATTHSITAAFVVFGLPN